jgi:arylsulfatase A-like enzyme
MKCILFLLVFVAGARATSLCAGEPPRPNILYFYCDDMGWGSIGPNGQAKRKADGKPYVRTPNLDRLAAEGINFSRGYGCHVCSPARSSQQSGFHQGHTYSDRNDPDNAKKAMRADEVLMGDALLAAGYVTGYWGKWGYGGSKSQINPVIENVQTLPTSHGYTHVLAELHHVRAHTFFQPTLWSAPAPGAIGGLKLIPNSLASYQNRPGYPKTPALQDHPDYPDTAYCDDVYAFAALDFVREQGRNYNQTGQPFFGLLAVQIPHAPFGEVDTLPAWDSAYAEDPQFDSLADQTKQWAAMVTRIDAHFGNILAALEDPNNDGDTSDSVADNTLVIFQSDNGGPSGKNNVQLDANGGLRGNKGQIQEGGIRVPLVIRWPAMISSQSAFRAGSDSQMIVDVTDLLPTFCELAGAVVPLGVDGVSIAPRLTDSGYQRQREFIIHEAGNGQSIIRGNHKLVRGKNSRLQLYDLKADPVEEQNIAADHPELVKELETLLLGERVAERKGFANTYHQWTGEDAANASEADNWSDYQYANAGITYITDAGAPQLSWIAKIENANGKASVARAASDLEFLALEVGGATGIGETEASDATQTLELGPGVNLTGRNEIRLSRKSILVVDGGTVSSIRWVDIQPGGTLTGRGAIDGTVFNNGLIKIGPAKGVGLTVNADYHQSESATLTLPIHGQQQPSFRISGDAWLGGSLSVETSGDFKPQPGSVYTVITANRVLGTFANPENQVVASDGTRFTIRYSDFEVVLSN